MALVRCFVALSILIFLSTGIAQTKKKGRPLYEEIKEDIPVIGVINLAESSEYWLTYTFELPEDVSAFRIWTKDSVADLDLCVQQGSPMEDYSETEWCSELEQWNEDLLVHSLYSDSYESGTWYVDVFYQVDERPRDEQGLILSELPFELNIEFLFFETESELLTGKPVTISLTPEWHAISWFEIDVPKEIEELRIDVFNTDGDIDLLLTKKPFGNYDDAIVVSQSIAGNESLIYQPEAGIDSGTYYLAALDPFLTVDPVSLSLIVNFSSEIPELLKEEISPMSNQIGPHGAPIGATVQIMANSSWGSGNIISQDGWILTNDHVVRAPNGELFETVIVAAVADPSYPAKETFRARVVDGLKEPDLALLKIEEGLYSQPIPNDYHFPYWKWGDSSNLKLGDDIFVVGFPSIGGSGSRPIFTFSRGYLAGREQGSKGSALMTDALISGGSSGGGLTSGNGELLALPTFTIGDETIQMSYALSLDQVPESWKQLIGID